ncbi:hypothetical protein [Desnuesiella massiliensis]|uniref:hypothetical protein n=1 Tax=Desnuesiella massiliensis TaxID=1650662 RepID=UPI0006E1E698|nr:hypothetical protein [Desnuesiella massiliensis]
MKKRILVSVVLLLALIIFAIMYINSNHKRISEIGGFQANDITKISFQYNNPAIKGGTVENKENINEFMNYINSCVFTKKLTQTLMAGYYQSVILFIGDNKVMSIMTYENFIDINGIQYNMVKNKLSLEKIDDFIKSKIAIYD